MSGWLNYFRSCFYWSFCFIPVLPVWARRGTISCIVDFYQHVREEGEVLLLIFAGGGFNARVFSRANLNWSRVVQFGKCWLSRCQLGSQGSRHPICLASDCFTHLESKYNENLSIQIYLLKTLPYTLSSSKCSHSSRYPICNSKWLLYTPSHRICNLQNQFSPPP